MEPIYKNLSLDSMDGETWEDIPSFEGVYQASTKGRIKSLARFAGCQNGSKRRVRERILSPCKDKKGYLQLTLAINNGKKRFAVHYLVAKTYIPNPLCLEGVNHGNYIKHDNSVGNLSWMTNPDNAKDAWKNKKVPYQVGFDASNVTFLREEVIDIYNSALSIKELAKKYNRTYPTIYAIKSGHTFTEITNGISNIKSKRPRISVDIIKEVCESKLPVRELSKKIGLTKQKIHNIKYRYNGLGRQ